MNSSTHRRKNLYTCIKCKKELPVDIDPKILEIVGGSLLCGACSKTLLPHNRSGGKLQIPAEGRSACDAGSKAFSAEADPNSKFNSCEVCSRTFFGTGGLCSHLQEKLLACDECARTFATRTEQIAHSLTHAKGEPYICTECEKAFTLVARLREHFSRHTAEEPHICDVCNAAFARESALILHDCPYVVEFPWKCDECPASFVQHFSLKQHSRVHAAGGRSTAPIPVARSTNGPCVCEVCDKAYTEKATLERHLLFDTGEKPFASHLCDRTYPRKSLLKMRQHTEKPYVCEVCGKAFAQRFRIVSHFCEERNSRSDNKCTTICARSPTLTVLKPAAEDRRVDASEENASGQLQRQKPQVCVECGRGFSKAHELKLHLRTHAGERIIYECDVCENTFLKHHTLKMHQWRCHELDRNRFKNIIKQNKD